MREGERRRESFLFLVVVVRRQSIDGLARSAHNQLFSLSLLHKPSTLRTVVSKQAEFEKAVFAKTARINARGDGEKTSL